MDTTKARILARVRRKGAGVVVTPKDFLDLAGRDAVDQALSRLVRQDALQRIGHGLYHVPRKHAERAVAYARKHLSSEAALNRRVDFWNELIVPDTPLAKSA